MNQGQFQLWRFRTTEGVLDGIDHYNMTDCYFKDGSHFIYDAVNEIITIENNHGIEPVTETLRFKECTLEKLKTMGFVERTENRHSQSYQNENNKPVFKD